MGGLLSAATSSRWLGPAVVAAQRAEELSGGRRRWRRAPLLPRNNPLCGQTQQKRANGQRGKTELFPHPESVFILLSNTFRLESGMRFHFLFISLIFFIVFASTNETMPKPEPLWHPPTLASLAKRLVCQQPRARQSCGSTATETGLREAIACVRPPGIPKRDQLARSEI